MGADGTPTQQLAELLLGEPLEDWVGERRTEFARRSWRRIAMELAHRTNGRVNVTGETLRLWFGNGSENDGDGNEAA